MTASGNLKMTVNVSLCGSIPRSEMMACGRRSMSKSPPKFPFLSLNTAGASDRKHDVARRHRKSCAPDSNTSHSSIIEPPQWAVPARGDARLEPIGDAKYSQFSIDLTTRACVRLGRSQSSDVQLLHDTSSRRHAIIFHHPNGSCYVVDCGSAHGTYVNGVRVNTTIMQSSENGKQSRTGKVVPHRVKKGSLIRFGGKGAPSFVLKSFSVRLDRLLKDFEETKKSIVHDERKDDCPFKSKSLPSESALLTLNTRLNAIGRGSNSMAALATARLYAEPKHLSPYKKKRALSQCASADTISDKILPKKRKLSIDQLPLSTFPLSGLDLDVAIVSPSRRKETISFDPSHLDRPVVSPNPLDCNHLLEMRNCAKSILTVSTSLQRAVMKVKKGVRFCDKGPEVFFPPAVTPETSSDTESEEK